MANPFTHIELHTSDLERAKKFYSELFDWQVTDVPMGETTYSLIQVGEGVGGGMMSSPSPESAHWLSFVQVNDVGAGLRKAQALGGTILQEKTPIPGNGFFGVIVDPTGAALGLIEHG